MGAVIANAFRQAWEDVKQGENVELYLVVIAAAVLVALDVLGVDVSGLVGSATLATLALVALGLLGNRRRMSLIAQTSMPVLKLSRDCARPELVIASAKRQVWVSGISFGTISYLTRELESRVDHGCRLRFLAMEPSDSAARELSSYFGEETPDYWKANMQSNLLRLHDRLATVAPERVEIRTVRYRPSLGSLIIDPDDAAGRVSASIYMYHVPGTDARPMLDLQVHSHPAECRLLVEDFERQWRDAKIWSPHHIPDAQRTD